MGCNSTYRLRYWNDSDDEDEVSESMLTVATVLTVYGIETYSQSS